jgi:hypothetical protein
MTTPNPFRYGPTRGELWFWLWVSLFGIGLIGVAVGVRGIPEGPALFEVIGLPVLLFSYLLGRSVKRLIRREHP